MKFYLESIKCLNKKTIKIQNALFTHPYHLSFTHQIHLLILLNTFVFRNTYKFRTARVGKL